MLIGTFKALALRAALLLGLLCSNAEAAVHLGSLDDNLARAGSVEGWLASPELIEEYYRLAAEYYGGEEKFPRKAFDTVVEQIRLAVTRVPGFSERAFKPTAGEEFTITADAPTFGRRIDEKAWARELAKWTEALRTQAGTIADLSQDDLDRKVTEYLADLARRRAKLDASHETRNSGKKVRGAEIGEFYTQAAQSPEFRSLSAASLLAYLKDPTTAWALVHPEAELVLNQIEAIWTDPTAMVPAFDDAPQTLLAQVRKLVPDFKKGDAFPTALRASNKGKAVAAEGGKADTYRFFPLKYAFHTFFKGISIRECLAGRLDYITSTTPERWALDLMNGVIVHYVERGDVRAYEGWTHAVPVTASDGIVGSIELGAPLLKRKLLQRDSAGKLRVRTFFVAWLEELKKQLPKDWLGLVVGKSNNANHAGALGMVRVSSEYLLGKRYAAPFQYSMSDPIIDPLTKVIPRPQLVVTYSRGPMVFDAILKDAGALTLLEPTGKTSLEAVQELHASGNAATINASLSLLYEASFKNAATAAITLKEAGILGFLSDQGYQITPDPAQPLQNFAAELVSNGLSAEEIRHVRRLFNQGPLTNELATAKVLIPLATSPADFLSYVTPVFQKGTSNTEYYSKMAIQQGQHVQAFLALNPTENEAVAYAGGLSGADAWRATLDYIFAKATTVADLERIRARFTWSGATGDYAKAAGQALAAAVSKLLGLSPPRETLEAWAPLIPIISPESPGVAAQFALASSEDGFVALWLSESVPQRVGAAKALVALPPDTVRALWPKLAAKYYLDSFQALFHGLITSGKLAPEHPLFGELIAEVLAGQHLKWWFEANQAGRTQVVAEAVTAASRMVDRARALELVLGEAWRNGSADPVSKAVAGFIEKSDLGVLRAQLPAKIAPGYVLGPYAAAFRRLVTERALEPADPLYGQLVSEVLEGERGKFWNDLKHASKKPVVLAALDAARALPDGRRVALVAAFAWNSDDIDVRTKAANVLVSAEPGVVGENIEELLANYHLDTFTLVFDRLIAALPEDSPARVRLIREVLRSPKHEDWWYDRKDAGKDTILARAARETVGLDASTRTDLFERAKKETGFKSWFGGKATLKGLEGAIKESTRDRCKRSLMGIIPWRNPNP